MRRPTRRRPARRRSPRRRGRARGARARRLAAIGLVSIAAVGAGVAAARSGLAAQALGSLAPGSLELPDLGSALRGPRFQLRTLDFLGLRALRARDLAGAAGVEPGVPLVEVDPGAVCRRLEALPRVAGCAAARVPPDRLLVELRERTPLAVQAGDGVDAEGVRFPLAPGEAAALPRVTGTVERALPLLRAARDAGVALDEVSAPEPDGLAFRPAGARVQVRVGRDVERSLRDWRRLAASGLVEARGAGAVDLRFSGSAVLRDFGDTKGGETDGPS